MSKKKKAIKIIEAHNLDYDNYLNTKHKITEKNYAIYIDQDFADNDDLKNDGIKFDSKNFEKNENFLNRFNQKIINVKIAGSNRRRVKKIYLILQQNI